MKRFCALVIAALANLMGCGEQVPTNVSKTVNPAPEHAPYDADETALSFDQLHVAPDSAEHFDADSCRHLLKVIANQGSKKH